MCIFGLYKQMWYDTSDPNFILKKSADLTYLAISSYFPFVPKVSPCNTTTLPCHECSRPNVSPVRLGICRLGRWVIPWDKGTTKFNKGGGNEWTETTKQANTNADTSPNYLILWFYANKLGNSIHSMHQIGEQQIQQYLCFFHLTCQGFLPTVPLHISTAEGPPSPVFHSFI